jgi:uncharacterized membrane-anchored protein
MKKYKWILIIVNLLLILGLFNYSIFQKEKMLKNGTLVLLKLAPVDPRSLMQGDYMSLNYEISNIAWNKNYNIPQNGFCIVELNKNHAATFIRIQKESKPLKTNEFAINYKKSNFGIINLGAESYFFEEGKGKKFEKAVYGGLKIDKNGQSVLVGLYDKKLKRI